MLKALLCKIIAFILGEIKALLLILSYSKRPSSMRARLLSLPLFVA
jgi:hypothetical protein